MFNVAAGKQDRQAEDRTEVREYHPKELPKSMGSIQEPAVNFLVGHP